MSETTLIAIRTVIAFIWLFIVARLIGPKQVSQLSFFDYVSGVTIGSMASSLAVETEMRPVAVFTGLGMFAVFAVGMTWLRHSRYNFRKWIDGEPIVLVSDGKLKFESLGFARMTIDEMVMLLRRAGVFDLEEVDWAWLEPTGQISVKKKAIHQPATAKRLGIPVPTSPQAHQVIIDGKVLRATLKDTGKTEEWLHDRLTEQGISDPGEVAVGQVKGDSLFVWRRDDKTPLIPAPSTGDLLRLNLQKAQAELELFALDTGNKDAQRLYAESSRRLQGVLEGIDPFLRG